MKKKKLKQSLKQLIKDWDERLKAAGFNDIEDRETDRLKSWAGNISFSEKANKQSHFNYGYTSLTWKESQGEYYRIASQILHEAEFKNERQRTIWELHCEGLSGSEIAKKLKLTKRQVKYAIARMAKDFGLIF